MVVQILVEGNDKNGVNEVDKRVSNVAPIVQVQGQVEEVKRSVVVPVDALEKHVLSVLVGNVPNHDRGT